MTTMKLEILIIGLIVLAVALSGCIQPAVCGNGICENGENESNCTPDCKASSGDCQDGTTEGKCSETSPLICRNGELVPECKVCGCLTNLFSCGNNGDCTKKELTAPNYDCTFCQGFCYVRDKLTKSHCTSDGRYFEWRLDEENGEFQGKQCNSDNDCIPPEGHGSTFKCIENHCLNDIFSLLSYNGIGIKLDYPRNVSDSFVFKITATNNGSTPVKVRIADVRGSKYTADYGEDEAGFDSTKEIASASSEKFEITIPKFKDNTYAGEVQFGLFFPERNASFYFSSIGQGPIIASFACKESEMQTCGNLKYCKETAVCKDNTLYPSNMAPSCMKNSDCMGSSDVCVNYTCRGDGVPKDFRPKLDKTNKIGIFTPFIFDDDQKYSQARNQKRQELRNLASSATAWANSERSFWNAKNNFSLDFSVIEKECRFTTQEYIRFLKSCNGIRECEEKFLAECGIDKSYDVIARIAIFEEGLSDQEIIVELTRLGYTLNGFSLGDIVVAGYGMQDNKPLISLLLHETLHSFGEKDLYQAGGGSFFQEGNCNLFKGNGHFDKDPHLCDWEAKMIGWKD